MEYAAQYAENYSSIENTIKRGAETVAGAIGRGLTALGTMAVAAAIPSSKQIKTDSRNGQLSTSELKDIGNGQKLSIAAADAFLLMKADAAKEGVNIQLSDSYRSLARQNAIFDWDHYNKTGKRRKKGTSSTAAAYPGTSNHGLGRAIDVSNTAAQKWIRDNGEKYGWSWAEGRAVGEPWHFTYVK
jgi:LAS superfamily LD-carboxypeptidase LdcB